VDEATCQLLTDCAKQFRYYERAHTAKIPDLQRKLGGDREIRMAREKAEINANMASRIERHLGTLNCQDEVLDLGDTANAHIVKRLDPVTRAFDIQDDVLEFTKTFCPDWLQTEPRTPLTVAEAETRSTWIKSEAIELVIDTTNAFYDPSTSNDDIAELMAKQADAFLDAVYFSIGGLVRLGIDFKPLWNIIHGQNMAKRQPDGSVSRRAHDGKVIKPDGWVDPHELLVAEIKRQLAL
jgi:hypothetical protein